ncbi:MAG: hypothetical protein IT372_40235 [Polyangiaceae bacterium]|nr:hypothetical protein [Polyangiaceae bacterium]
MTAFRKLLVESSAVPAAIGRTTEAHRALFDEISRDAELHASVYIRKELLRRWLVDYVHLTQVIARSPSVADALRRLSNDFSGRAKGSYMNALADLDVDLSVPADGNELVEGLAAFCERLAEPVKDCAVNGFLDLGNAGGNVARLLACKQVASCKKISGAAGHLRGRGAMDHL